MSPEEIISLLIAYKYVILVPLAAFEGPVVSLAVGFLIHAGVFSFWPAYAILIFGDLVPDSFFYLIGLWGNRAKIMQGFLSRLKFFRAHWQTIERLWMKHTFEMIFFGKLAYGMALPFLISAGMANVRYKRLISYTIPVSLFQYGILMLIGRSAGVFYFSAGKYLDLIFIALTIVGIVLIIRHVSRYSKQRLFSMEEEAERESGA